ncbi:M4 family metallopeptidase [Lewinella sp. W8]|uniref:M4 family metallopeptidase n=1 Tax=Lewinella sp. W8 TaxID=2528208 RepID=UPI0010673C80|nr:M4 family metallopeptidase [Lewinella sp. W8]MTB49852.1 T9SS type A sorting domain-containing protein [Lewinella sp. W8]
MLRFLIGFAVLCLGVTPLSAQSPDWAKSKVFPGQYFLAPTPEIPLADAGEQLPAAIAAALGDTRPDQWRLHRRSVAQNHHHFHHYQQVVRGFPVLGGSLQLQITPEATLRSVSGRFFPDTAFVLPQHLQAPQRALPRIHGSLSPYYPHIGQWNYRIQDTVWMPRGLFPGQASRHDQLAFVMDFTEPGGVQAHRILLDAATGKILDHFPLHCSLVRRLFHRTPSRVNLIWEEGQPFPGILAQEDQEALLATEETYALFWRTFGRNSYDGNGARLNIVTQAQLNNCPNAVASGNRISHCPGVVTDDIVAHEWTHNYLASMNGLVYQYESGAINEAFADIFGEVVDLLNDRGLDDMDQLPRQDCEEANVRWKIAEGTPALESHIRDLWLPECKEHPSTIDSPDFACLPLMDDFGGVHINSGLINRAFSLLTDGGSVDTLTVAGIGLTKSAHIFWHAAQHYLGPVTSFSNLADILEQSGQDLLGADLTELTLVNLPAATASDVITAADVEQLRRAVLAVGLRTPLPCDFPPALNPGRPETCAESLQGTSPVSIFREDWENGLPAGWEVSSAPENPDSWTDKSWRLTDLLPNGRAGTGILAPSPQVGNCQLDLENGLVHLSSPPIVLPAVAVEAFLEFDHYFATESGLDGGVLDIALGEGPFVPVETAHFTFNPYVSPLEGSNLNDNPLAGRAAFHGTDTNSDTGSWGTSIVDLTAAGVIPGQPFRLRWTMGHDGCNGWVGWYLDEVEIGYCDEASLPVTYRSIEAVADKDRVHLRWELDLSENNAGFFVERQGPEENEFRSLAFVPARGYAYVYLDHEVRAGATYTYRLRQRDLDGTESYSPLVAVSLPEPALRLGPNPAGDFLTVHLSDRAGPATGILYSLSGQKMMEFSLKPGETHRLSTSRFPAGIYLIKVGDRLQKVEIRR